MKLGPETKIDMRNRKTLKNLEDNVIWESCDFVVIFQFTANLEQSGSWIPDSL